MTLLRKVLFFLLSIALAMGDVPAVLAASVLTTNQQGQNLLKFSEQFDNAVWVKRGAVTITADAIANPINGKMDADLISNLNGLGVSDIYNSDYSTNKGVDGSRFTPSFWIKRVSTSGVLRVANPQNTTFGDMTINLATIGDGWVRIFPGAGGVTVAQPFVYGATGRSGMIFWANSGGPISFYIWGAQQVNGTLPTAYNPTTSSYLNSTFVPSGVTLSNQRGQNRLLYSEQFDVSPWVNQANVTTTADQAFAPDGTFTADLIDVSSASANTGIYQLASTGGRNILGNLSTKSVWIKGVLGTEVVTLGDPQFTEVVSICTLTTAWKRCYFTDPPNATRTAGGLWIRKSSGNQFYVWGAQLEVGRLGPYNKTIGTGAGTTFFPAGSVRTSSQRGQNLLVRSEELESASWSTQTGVTITPNIMMAPDGTMTADRVSIDVGDSYFLQTPTVSPSNTFTFSVWLYAPTSSKATIAAVVRGTASNTPLVGRTCTITNQWTRCSFTGTVASNDAAAYAGFENRAFAGGDALTGFFYAWGAQLTYGTKPGAYNKAVSAAVNANYRP